MAPNDKRSSKRASMREGPLAALFRKTDGVDEQQELSALESVSTPAQHAASAPALNMPEPGMQTSPRYAQPLPSNRRPEPQIVVRPTTPQERLRQAFSSDIPDNIMAPPRPQQPAVRVDDAWHQQSDLQTAPPTVGHPQLLVVGVGGAGVNAVNRMIEANITGVDFLAINTDAQSLQQSSAPHTLQIGAEVTRGLGSGSDPELGRTAAMEDHDKTKALLRGADMVFITAGSGGGTGTGAAPVVARIARELGALTVGIVTKPFGFEGSRRAQVADQGVKDLAAEVDTLIVVPNNRLLSVLDRNTSMVDAFRVADDVLRQGVQGISDLITLPGLINLDFADVRTIMSNAGSALLGIGMGSGEKRAVEAAAQAISSPLLETSVDGARAILLSITGGQDLSLWEVNEAAKAVQEAAHPDANIIFGAMLDETLSDEIWITVVATGYDAANVVSAGRGRDTASSTRAKDEFRVTSLRDKNSSERLSSLKRTSESEKSTEESINVDIPEFIPKRGKASA